MTSIRIQFYILELDCVVAPPLQLKEAKLVLLKADLGVSLIDLTPSVRSLVQDQMSGSPGRLQIPYVDYDVLPDHCLFATSLRSSHTSDR